MLFGTMKKNVLFFPETDPRSGAYPRVLDMPVLHWPVVLLRAVLPLAVLAGLFFLLRQTAGSTVGWVVTGICWLSYSALRLKSTLLTLVRMYQRLAPKKIRLRCRYEPSCSQYMILSVEKYGPVKGCCKGIRRLCRCNSRGDGCRGGYDAP